MTGGFKFIASSTTVICLINAEPFAQCLYSHRLSQTGVCFSLFYFFFLIKNIKRDSCAVNGQRSDTKSVATSPQSPGPTAVVLRAFYKTEFVCGNLHMLMMMMGPSNHTKTTGAAGVQCSLLPCRLLFTEHKPVATECSGRTGQ